ncbi:hypothetical protein PYCCODRAFT_228056 [Trametes coccinea BRFM310]|uniref:Uncharacterized protein n=1 Tax=Trametes coccinea (strain BRFM310) TaxID=1353009 RepID=A0A1Y2IQW9_TRAC3|nr:hypothetical protein PYCCODRAFT_228056 [Trametes coccinea BRFM310]
MSCCALTGTSRRRRSSLPRSLILNERSWESPHKTATQYDLAACSKSSKCHRTVCITPMLACGCSSRASDEGVPE